MATAISVGNDTIINISETSTAYTPLWGTLPRYSYTSPVKRSYFNRHVISDTVLLNQDLNSVTSLLTDQTTSYAINDIRTQITTNYPDFPTTNDIRPYVNIDRQDIVSINTGDGIHEITIRVDAGVNAIAYVQGHSPFDRYVWHSPEALAQTFKSVIKQNLLIKIAKKNERQPLINPENQAELKARQSLRDMISEAEWRRYVTNGFIMVKAPSGLWYQIFNRRNERMRVYKDNKWIESICIHSDDSCPPTDHVINVKVSLEIDEESVRAGGNINKPYLAQETQRPQPKLIEAFNNYKQSKLRLSA